MAHCKQELGGIQANVEALAGIIVLAEPTDLPMLADLHSRMEQIEHWAAQEGLGGVADAAKATAVMIEEIILNEVPDGRAALEIIGRTISSLQAIALEGRDPNEVSFPQELGIKECANAAEPENPANQPVLVPGESPVGSESESVSSSTMIEGDPTLLGEFINEAREHLDAVDMHLLTLETDGHNEEALNSVFRAFHTIKGVAGMLGLSTIGALAHEAENLLDRARKHELEITSHFIDVIFATVDALKVLVNDVHGTLTTGESVPPPAGLPQLLDTIRQAARGSLAEDTSNEGNAGASGSKLKLGEILLENGTVTLDDIDGALKRQETNPGHPRLGQVLVEEGKLSAQEVVSALRTQKSTVNPATAQFKETVKVDAERLDRLVETIGELVIAESMVSQSSKNRDVNTAGFFRHLNELDKITRELQEMGTSLRMVPLRATFQKMARLVRDLAKKSGKQVEFAMAGEDTELDKTVVDQIGDPLVHMVRNAVDHGLEARVEDRRRLGKADVGRVELRAFHKGGNIYIEIEDDGRGLDREAILTKGRERGLIPEGETPSDREIYNLIFQPGFSTAKKITDVSGRGVGMDVVKRNIDALRGQVEIRTETGKGSMLSIRLPLTLAIIDGMVVRVGHERYIIPTLSVIVSLRPESQQLSSVLGRSQMLSLQNEQIPLFHLDRLLNIDGAEQDPGKALAVVVEDDGHKMALLVDELLGQQQIVIKSLGESIRGIPGVSGGAIMPDGRVGLILDVSGVIRLAQMA